MDINEENPNNQEIPLTDETEAEPTEPVDIALNEAQVLEKNLGLVKFFDYIIANPLNVIFQPKLVNKYRQELIHPLLGPEEIPPKNADRGRMFLRDEYYEINIEKKAVEVIETAENISKEHGFRTSINKRFSIAQLIITAISLGGYFLLASFFRELSTYFLVGSMLIMCFGSQGVRTLITKQWEAFQKTYEPEIREKTSENCTEIKGFVQNVIDDTRERLLNQSLPLEKFQFALFSTDYENVRFIRNQATQRGAPLTAVYQFEYPEGMGPKTTTIYGETSTIQENENDEFIVLKNAVFNDDGQLNSYTDKKVDDKIAHQIELLLNVSEFKTVDNPEAVFPNFNEGDTKISCSCEETIQFKSMKTCISPLHNNFEFYMIVANQCSATCGVSSYILFTSPGNKSIPEGLQPIFT